MEKAVLVVTEYEKNNWSIEDLTAELKELTRAARTQVCEQVSAKLKQINPAYFIGEGKLDEIANFAQTENADVVIFNDNLSGTQQKNIEDIIGLKTIDRTQLILDIFARRAKSNEGKLQVELAQLEYLLPRLTGQGIMLSRLGGGIGTRGPGEMKLEVDRRRIKTRISKLRKDLTNVHKQRETRRKYRQRFSSANIALVGYTNAGKSTLLNTLTDSAIYTDNMLFSTLDASVRKATLPNNQKVLLIDTVGFLYKLPHRLVEAFKATLEETIEADILIHVLDMSHPKLREQSEAVYEVLRELKIEAKPIITVLNKMDKIEDPFVKERLIKDFDGSIAVSALRKENLDKLKDKISLKLSHLLNIIRLKIPLTKPDLLYKIHREGKVIKTEYHKSYIYVEAQVPEKLKKALTTE